MKLNDNNFQASWKASEQSHEQLSATQAYELAEIKRHLEENNALMKTAASETKDSSLRLSFGMYIDPKSPSVSNTDALFREYLKNLGTDILSFMEKIW